MHYGKVLLSALLPALGVLSCSNSGASGGFGDLVSGDRDRSRAVDEITFAPDLLGSISKETGEIRGTITFPSSLPRPARATLTLFAGSYSRPVTVTVAGGNVKYALTRLAPGAYKVAVVIDSNTDGKIDEVDWAGFAGGSTAAPVLKKSEAREVAVAGGPVNGVDFGIGIVRACHGVEGASCQTDEDCRVLECVCGSESEGDSGGPSEVTYGVPLGCRADTKTCSANTDVSACQLACQPNPVVRSSSGACLRGLAP